MRKYNCRSLLQEVGVDFQQFCHVKSGDKNGWTPLLMAAMYGHEAVVRLLLAEGELVSTHSENKHGQTPLSLAIRNGHDAVVKLLTEGRFQRY
jgi:ankyrin repeat protein